MTESSVPGAVGDYLTAAETRRLMCVCGHRLRDHTEYGCSTCQTEHSFRRTFEAGGAVGEREEPLDRLALREELAALEHEQWEAWSRDVARLGLTTARRQRWARYWVPYADLDETAKDADREWADKVLAILARLSVNEGGVAPPTYDAVERLDRPGNRANGTRTESGGVAPVEPQEPRP